MLGAIVAMYHVTNSIIGTVVITAAIGVRQGSPTSCLLFIIYVNNLINVKKENCELDGFLSWLHLLILMDDTVLLLTSRVTMMRMLSILCQFCREYGMKINEMKTKFMVICGSEADTLPITVEDLQVNHCNSYIYLGLPFTVDGSTSLAVKAHAKGNMAHCIKFVSFL